MKIINGHAGDNNIYSNVRYSDYKVIGMAYISCSMVIYSGTRVSLMVPDVSPATLVNLFLIIA